MKRTENGKGFAAGREEAKGTAAQQQPASQPGRQRIFVAASCACVARQMGASEKIWLFWKVIK